MVLSISQLLGTILREGELAEEKEKKGIQENLVLITRKTEDPSVIISPENLRDDEVHFT